MSNSADDLDLISLATELGDDWREACRDALTSPSIRSKLAGLDSNERLEAVMLLFGIGGIFMPLANTAVQLVHGAVNVVAGQAEKKLRATRNAQQFHDQLIQVLNEAETRLVRTIAGSERLSRQGILTDTDRRRDIMRRYFKATYIDQRGSPWRLNKTQITRDMIRRIGAILDDWVEIPSRCNSLALRTGHFSTLHIGGGMRTHVDRAWVATCIREKRQQMKRRLNSIQ